MWKLRFVAANKSIGWFILAILISLATISMLDELSAAWLRFIVVMTLTKIVWHCLDKSRWIWGIYVSKKENNMLVNSLHSQIKKNENDIIIHLNLYARPEEQMDERELDIEKSVFSAMDKWMKMKEHKENHSYNTVKIIDAEIMEEKKDGLN